MTLLFAYLSPDGLGNYAVAILSLELKPKG